MDGGAGFGTIFGPRRLAAGEGGGTPDWRIIHPDLPECAVEKRIFPFSFALF